jgi:hypothetical protein
MQYYMTIQIQRTHCYDYTCAEMTESWRFRSGLVSGARRAGGPSVRSSEYDLVHSVSWVSAIQRARARGADEEGRA